ncbi:hypothetical protein WR25_14866 [Diploscapter pachys]|uniref:Uncharacterized protein n=1 Tax=Diploscapter pachys TaxID=2018661 RepID=A0A2A2KN14_9BILA|nr:hypothetical protein WR25_14866 [Diploscapter pachys]
MFVHMSKFLQNSWDNLILVPADQFKQITTALHWIKQRRDTYNRRDTASIRLDRLICLEDVISVFREVNDKVLFDLEDDEEWDRLQHLRVSDTVIYGRATCHYFTAALLKSCIEDPLSSSPLATTAQVCCSMCTSPSIYMQQQQPSSSAAPSCGVHLCTTSLYGLPTSHSQQSLPSPIARPIKSPPPSTTMPNRYWDQQYTYEQQSQILTQHHQQSMDMPQYAYEQSTYHHQQQYYASQQTQMALSSATNSSTHIHYGSSMQQQQSKLPSLMHTLYPAPLGSSTPSKPYLPNCPNNPFSRTAYESGSRDQLEISDRPVAMCPTRRECIESCACRGRASALYFYSWDHDSGTYSEDW